MAVAEQIAQLDQARLLVAQDPSFYPQIIAGILPIASSAEPSIRGWVAGFLDATFSNESLNLKTRQDLVLQGVLGTLTTLLASHGKSADLPIADGQTPGKVARTEMRALMDTISCSASVYPLIFHYMCTKANGAGAQADQKTWSKMASIKSKILSLWENERLGVRIACVKFAQRVLLAQTPGMKDPRLADIADPSLTLLPLNHPLLTHPILEAEAQGLLDRLLSLTYERSTLTPLLTACMNVLPRLIKTRTTTASKAISALLQIRPVDLDLSQLERRCVDKQLRIILSNLLRTNAAGPYASKIAGFLQSLAPVSMFGLGPPVSAEDRKRPMDEDGDEPHKRVRTSTPLQDTYTPPPPFPALVPPEPTKDGSMSCTQFFTLTSSELAQLDVRQVLQESQIVRITIDCLRLIDPNRLEAAIAALKSRYNKLAFDQYMRPPPSQEIEEDGTNEDFEPSPPLTLAPYSLPSPEPLSTTNNYTMLTTIIDRLLSHFSSLPSRQADAELGFGKLMTPDSQQGLVCMVARLCTRTPENLGNHCRERVFSFVTNQFKDRIELTIGWLTEEWFSEKLRRKDDGEEKKGTDSIQSIYVKWATRVLDAVLPFFEVRDRVLLRFLSELPEIESEILFRVKEVCLDPDRQRLGFLALQFLIMLRPPVRAACLDIVEELSSDVETKSAADKLLQKWRPGAVKEEKAIKEETVESQPNGERSTEPNGERKEKSEEAASVPVIVHA